MTEYTAEAIADHFRGLILTAQWGSGDRLPTVRQTARDLGVALGTAAKAYRMLEAEGFVETRGAAGTRVSNQRSVVSGKVLECLRTAVEVAQEAGVSRADTLRALQSIWDARSNLN